jgi:hypothetical protein
MAKRTLFDLGISRSATSCEEGCSIPGFYVDGNGGTTMSDTGRSESVSEEEDDEPPTASSACDSECCKSDRVKPNQPESCSVLLATTRVGLGQSRSVNSSWFTRFPWLTLCETRCVLLCLYCVEAKRRKLLTKEAGGCVYEDWIQQLEESS